jgi:hypothetical protein
MSDQINKTTFPGVKLPANWTPMAPGEKVKLVTLDVNSSEYRDVAKNVNSTAGNSVTQILKVCLISKQFTVVEV